MELSMAALGSAFTQLKIPVQGTGRIARFALIPLSELGRPRIDVLCNMSGIFRCVPVLVFLTGWSGCC